MKIRNKVVSKRDGAFLQEDKSQEVFKSEEYRQNWVLNIYPDRKYQKVLGFGAAFTETSAYNYAGLSEAQKKKVIDAYFDKEKGLGFNLCRTHIHSCDFSLDRYTYVEENDNTLKTFSIDRDRKYIIPFIHEALEAAGDMILFASPWSPPAWMKDNNELVHGGRLMEEYYQLWADYMVRYVQEYEKEGIPIWGMTVQNEPAAAQTWESCEYSGEEEAVFARDYLLPALKKAGFDDMKLMIWDHNRERAYDRPRDTFAVPGARESIWGIAYHWYSGDHYSCLGMAHEVFPEKPLLLTECSVGGARGEATPGPHSSWVGVELLASEMIENFNQYMAAPVSWNMIVDENAGPYHDREAGCKAPIVADPEKDTVSLEPIYYAIAHFSKYIKRDAVRIGTSRFGDQIRIAAFQNPDGEICAVILNQMEQNQTVYLRMEGEEVIMELPAKSLMTCVISE